MILRLEATFVARAGPSAAGTLVLGALGLGALVSNCALPADFDKVDQAVGGAGGGAGGAGGGAASCDAFTLAAPAACDMSLLDNADSCCIQGRSCLGGACANGSCQPRPLDTSNSEAIAALAIGEWVVYSTGTDREIRRTRATGGPIETVYTGMDDGQAVTNLAYDGDRVFFTKFNRGEVWSVVPDDGPASARLVANNGTHQSWWGRIAVDASQVYWASEHDVDGYTPALWFAPKDGNNAAAQGVTIPGPPGTAQPFGVAVDQSHLYWTDKLLLGVFRIALGELTTPDAWEPFAPMQNEVGDLALSGDRVYWLAGGEVRSMAKTGGTVSTHGSSPNAGWTLALDATHAYWTSEPDNGVYRAPLEGNNRTDLIAPGDTPKGLAVGCSAVFFTTFTTTQPPGVFVVAK